MPHTNHAAPAGGPPGRRGLTHRSAQPERFRSTPGFTSPRPPDSLVPRLSPPLHPPSAFSVSRKPLTMSGVLFSDTFDLETVDYDPVTDKKEKKFDKVSRIDAKSENYDTEVTLDINSEIYPMKEGHKFEILLADRLYEDAADESEMPGYDPSRELDSRADTFEYIMHGKIFKYAEEKSRAVVYASFGGLLMALKGETRILPSHSFRLDSEVYLFMKRV